MMWLRSILKGKMSINKSFLMSLLLCLGVSSFSQVEITGVVVNEFSQERLPFVNIFTPDLLYSTTSDEYGQYSIYLNEESKFLIFSTIGFMTDTVETRALLESGKVRLKSADYTLQTVTVVSERENIETSYSSDVQTISRAEVEKIPVLMGQTDILKAYQLLPGVQGNQEGFSGLQVRGGSSDQTSYFLDGARVYNTNHLFGFLSTFHNSGIKHSSLEKGGISASRGEGMSANMELLSRDGNKLEHEGEIDLGILALGGFFSGPIKKNEVSYSLSGRTTFLDQLFKAINPDENPLLIDFYDLNVKIHYQNDKNTLQLSSYNSKDAFSAGSPIEKIEQGWGNNTISGRWSYRVNPKSTISNFLTWSRFKYGSSINQFRNNSKTFSSKNQTGIDDLGYDLLYEQKMSPKLTLSTGGGFHHIRHKTALKQHSDSVSFVLPDDVFASNNSNVHISLNGNYSRHQFLIGLRLGLQTVLNKNFYLLEPRLRYEFEASDKISISASGQLTSQTIHKVNSSGVGLQTDLWIPSNEKINPQRAGQVSLGLTYKDSKKYNLTLEGYYKHYFNIIDLRDNISYATFYAHGPEVVEYQTQYNWEDIVSSGIGYSYGLESSFQSKWNGPHDLYLAYTLGYAQNKMPFVNNGDWYWASTDRRHNFNGHYSYEWRERYSIHVLGSYYSGLRTTLPLSSYEDRPNPFWANNTSGGDLPSYLEISETNNFRLPSSYRVDVTLRKRGKKRPANYWEIGIYNLFNRNNPFYMEVKDEKVFAKGLYPILPSFTYHINLY